MSIWKRFLSGYQSPILLNIRSGEEKGWDEGGVRGRYRRKPFLRIAGNAVLDNFDIVK
jgi:hypothetical protein